MRLTTRNLLNRARESFELNRGRIRFEHILSFLFTVRLGVLTIYWYGFGHQTLIAFAEDEQFSWVLLEVKAEIFKLANCNVVWMVHEQRDNVGYLVMLECDVGVWITELCLLNELRFLNQIDEQLSIEFFLLEFLRV
jgi:hypothetical protein